MPISFIPMWGDSWDFISADRNTAYHNIAYSRTESNLRVGAPFHHVNKHLLTHCSVCPAKQKLTWRPHLCSKLLQTVCKRVDLHTNPGRQMREWLLVAFYALTHWFHCLLLIIQSRLLLVSDLTRNNAAVLHFPNCKIFSLAKNWVHSKPSLRALLVDQSTYIQKSVDWK